MKIVDLRGSPEVALGDLPDGTAFEGDVSGYESKMPCVIAWVRTRPKGNECIRCICFTEEPFTFNKSNSTMVTRINLTIQIDRWEE